MFPLCVFLDLTIIIVGHMIGEGCSDANDNGVESCA